LKIITHNKIARAKIPLPTPMMRVIFEEGWGPLRRLVRRSVGIRPLKTSFRYASIIHNPSSCSINIILLIFLILSSYLLHAVLTILYIYMFPYILLYIINIYIILLACLDCLLACLIDWYIAYNNIYLRTKVIHTRWLNDIS
jgi:hypothetical protein